MRQSNAVGVVGAVNKTMIIIDQANCIGCSLCVSLCPNHFQMNSEFKAETIGDDSDESCVQEAINNCPVSVISQK